MEIILYNEGNCKVLKTNTLTKRIGDFFPSFKIVEKYDFIRQFVKTKNNFKQVARKFASARIKDISKELTDYSPFPAENDYEYKNLLNPESKKRGIVYDGFKILNILSDLLFSSGQNTDNIHIAITNQLLATYELDDRRYHIRAVITGLPAIISTSGISAGPALPSRYYVEKGIAVSAGASDSDLELIKQKYKGMFIDYDDKRTRDAVFGYVLQAVFFSLTGESFCSQKNCRLYNAHWQEELIRQIDSKQVLCKKHLKILGNLNRMYI